MTRLIKKIGELTLMGVIGGAMGVLLLKATTLLFSHCSVARAIADWCFK